MSGQRSARAVQQAAADWVWVPSDAEQVRTGEYHLVAYPAYFSSATQLLWSRTCRPLARVEEEVLAQVRAWGRTYLDWNVRGTSEPANTADYLRSRGYELSETARLELEERPDTFQLLGYIDGQPAGSAGARWWRYRPALERRHPAALAQPCSRR